MSYKHSWQKVNTHERLWLSCRIRNRTAKAQMFIAHSSLCLWRDSNCVESGDDSRCISVYTTCRWWYSSCAWVRYEQQVYTVHVCCSSRRKFSLSLCYVTMFGKASQARSLTKPLDQFVCAHTHTHTYTGDGFNHRPTEKQIPLLQISLFTLLHISLSSLFQSTLSFHPYIPFCMSQSVPYLLFLLNSSIIYTLWKTRKTWSCGANNQ